MSAMDCGAATMPDNACFPAPVQTHDRNQDSHSSSLSRDAVPTEDRIPSPRRWSPTYQPRRSSRQFPNSLSFVPRSEMQEYSTSLCRRPASRGGVCISPFRSVRRMKEPFQLMLPSSPASASSPVSASCDGAPPFSTKSRRESKPPAGYSLRTWRSDQNLTSASLAAFGLLPSPPISDSRPASTGPEASYFEYKKDTKSDGEQCQESTEELTGHLVKEPGEGPSEASIDDLIGKPMEAPAEGPTGEPTLPFQYEEKIHYRAYRPPGWTKHTEEQQWRTDVTNVHEAHSNLMRQCEKSDADNPTGMSVEKHSNPITSPISNQSVQPEVPVLGSSPRPQRPRTATVSSEASWIPANFSYCQTWLQGVPFDPADDKDNTPKEFNRRKFQIVEKDPPMPRLDIIPGAKALDEPVRFAVASKPKLVDVTRQSSPAMPPPPSLLPHPLPMTPDQRRGEVSAFSPDTPLDMSDSGYGTRESGCSMDSFQGFQGKDDDTYSDPGSLTSDSVTSTVVGERPESAQGERARSPQPEIRSGSVSPQASPSPTGSSPGRASNVSEKEGEGQRLWDGDWSLEDHEWTLDELDHSVKDFPRHMLRLTSPAILYLRRSDEKDFLRPFRTIFPEVAENLLDCLGAALIARNYLLSLSTIHRRKPSLSSRNENYVVDGVPTKAYSTLGIQLPSGSPGRVKDRVLGSRSVELRREVERIIDNLLFAICGRSDDTLKSAVEVLAQVLETKVHH